MKTYTKVTKKAPEAVLLEAVRFLGKGGAGLELTEQCADCASFKGGGGFVHIRVCLKEAGTEVQAEVQEWEYWMERLLDKL
jgi:hypothetical protein